MQLGEHAHQRRGVVRACLRLHVIPPLISELVPGVRAADESPGDHVGVGASPAVPVVVALHAPDEAFAPFVGHDRGPPVVHPHGVLAAVPHQVADAHGIVAENVVDLRRGELHQFLGPDSPGRASEYVPACFLQVVRVRDEEEGGARDVLHVVPLADEEHATGRAVQVGAVVLAEASADVVLPLRFVLLQYMSLRRRKISYRQKLRSGSTRLIV